MTRSCKGGVPTRSAQLVARHQGEPLPAISLPGLSGGTLTNADLADQVTVLHFWEYRDEPLKEPYGQVGYLEFLYQKRKEQGVKVYGIAVDGRLDQQEAARRGHLGRAQAEIVYESHLPDRAGWRRGHQGRGDPRLIGATLPLVLVVGRDGRVTHYHTGFYEVDRQEGLKELDAAVTAALAR